jgi:hypothetical protein
MAGTGAIWRDNNVEGSSSDKIEFDTGSDPDALTKFGSTKIRLKPGLAFLKKPKAQMNKIQDTFVKGVEYRVIAWVKDPKASGAIDKTKVWGIDAKMPSTFPQGRFGIRLDDFPDFNVRPNGNRGCVLGDLEWEFIAGVTDKAVLIFDLFFQANSTGINSPTYNWNTT